MSPVTFPSKYDAFSDCILNNGQAHKLRNKHNIIGKVNFQISFVLQILFHNAFPTKFTVNNPQ